MRTEKEIRELLENVKADIDKACLYNCKSILREKAGWLHALRWVLGEED